MSSTTTMQTTTVAAEVVATQPFVLTTDTTYIGMGFRGRQA